MQASNLILRDSLQHFLCQMSPYLCHRLRFVQAGAATWRRCSSEGVHWFGATLTGRIASRGAAAQADVDPNQRNPLIRSFGFCAAHFWLNSFSCFFLVLRERFVIVDENRRCAPQIPHRYQAVFEFGCFKSVGQSAPQISGRLRITVL